MTNAFQQTAAECGCHASDSFAANREFGPVNMSVQRLAEWQERFGENLSQSLGLAMHGEGQLSEQLTPIALGRGAEYTELAEAGDIVVSAGLFPDSDPRIEIVGLTDEADGAAEYFTEDRPIAILRPLSEDVEYAENPALARLGSIASIASLGQSSGGGSAFNPLTHVRSAFDTVKSGFDAVRSGINTARSGVALAQDTISLGYRIVKVGRDIRRALGPLRLTTAELRLDADYSPHGLTARESVWQFTVYCKVRPQDRTPARFPFRVTVNHDCFNIRSARVTALSPTVPRTPFSEHDEGFLDDLTGFVGRAASGAANLAGQAVSGAGHVARSVGNTAFNVVTAPARAVANSATRVFGTHRLTLNITPDSLRRNNFPNEAAFRVNGAWDPADAGNLRDQIAATILVKANGEVALRWTGSPLVSVSTIRVRSGSSRTRCAPLYNRLRQQTGGGVAAPGSRYPHPSGGASRRPRRSRGGRGSSGRAGQGLVPDPRYGKHIFFANARSGSTAEIQALLQQWWATLPVNMQINVRSGQTAVIVRGHADPTGSESRNRALSHQRAETVAGIVRSLFGGSVRVLASGNGSASARTAGVRGADPSWRRVTVRLDAV